AERVALVEDDGRGGCRIGLFEHAHAAGADDVPAVSGLAALDDGFACLEDVQRERALQARHIGGLQAAEDKRPPQQGFEFRELHVSRERGLETIVCSGPAMKSPILISAHNPSAMTGAGNNTYLLAGADGSATLIDAGVGQPQHLAEVADRLAAERWSLD